MIPIEVEIPESSDQNPISTEVNIDIWDEGLNPLRLKIPFLGWLKFQLDKDKLIFLVRMKAHSGRLNGG